MIVISRLFVNALRLRIQEKETDNGVLSTLTIQRAQIDDASVYTCMVSNSHGQLERDFQLIVQGLATD